MNQPAVWSQHHETCPIPRKTGIVKPGHIRLASIAHANCKVLLELRLYHWAVKEELESAWNSLPIIIEDHEYSLALARGLGRRLREGRGRPFGQIGSIDVGLCFIFK